MKTFLKLQFLCMYCLAHSLAIGAQPIPESLLEAAPIPDWVDILEVTPPEAVPHADLSDGEYFLDLELQWHLPTQTKFFRTVVQIVGEAGLEENGEWSFNFDPEYETQYIHWVRIIRDGKVIYDFDLGSLRLYNTESDKASRLLNGSLTALVILEDLRPGDIVDVASSIAGENPAFGNEAVLQRSLSWSVPVRRQLTRILADPEQQLNLKTFFAEAPQESFSNETGLRELKLELENSEATRSEGSVPARIRVWDALHVSSFDGWAAVADWAVQLYPAEAPLPEEVQAELNRIKEGTDLTKERAKAALNFVQSNVRYLGLEMGYGAYRPRPPELVWQRRFGDCKDKAFLLVQMLRDLGIDAYPALVNTGWENGITDFLPSPTAFNHVIVCAEIEGVHYWMDPTYNRQIGSLDRLPVDRYGYALLVRQGEKNLTPVRDHPEYQNSISIKTKLTIARPGEASHIEIISRYSGEEAADIRRYFETTSLNEIGQNYTKYWASTYPHPELEEAIKYEEFPDTGEVEVREKYRIPDAWVPASDESDQKLYFEFSARAIRDYLVYPKRIVRQHPFAVGDTVKITERFEVHLFEPWDPDKSTMEITGPGILYTARSTWGQVVNADYEFERKLTEIEAKDVLEFESAMQDIYDDSGWELSWDPHFVKKVAPTTETAKKLDNPIAYALYGGGCFIALLLFVPFIFKQRLKPPKVIPEGSEYLEGIGGWLILPLIGLIITPISILAEIFGESLVWIFSQSQWQAAMETHSTSLICLVGVESTYNGFLMLTPAFLIFFMLKRRWFFPYLMIGYYVFQIVFQGIDLAWSSSLNIETDTMSAATASTLISFIPAMLWATYFGVSKRVKATFRS